MTGGKNGMEHDDVALRALLRAHSPEPPLDAVDWSALHGRITAQAAPLLRAGPGWWQQLALWSPRGAPFAAAVATALVVIILNIDAHRVDERQQAAQPQPAAAAAAVPEFHTIEEELAVGHTVLLANADADALLEAALFRGEGSAYE